MEDGNGEQSEYWKANQKGKNLEKLMIQHRINHYQKKKKQQ
jgi:hypothetical protein